MSIYVADQLQISGQSAVLSPFSLNSRFICQRARVNVLLSHLPASFITATCCRTTGRTDAFSSKQSRDSALRDAGETSDATPSPAKPAAQNDSQSSRIQPHNTTAPPAPTLHHHRSRHGLLIRLPSSTRLACDSYAPHPSPGIPHEQPQHVFC